MTAKTIEASGYSARFRVRVQKKRKRVNGRARGFYEGEFVYLRVTGPDGQVRDYYLGTSTRSRASSSKPAGEKDARSSAPAIAPAARPRGGRKRGQKTWRDASDDDHGETIPIDPHSVPMFQSEFARKQYREFERMGKRRK
jgi:hypothetical protein